MTRVRYTPYPQLIAQDRVALDGARITGVRRRGSFSAWTVTHPDGRVTVYSDHPNAIVGRYRD